jgi:two-component system phosphate regulon sensor histidine kinase PhoR
MIAGVLVISALILGAIFDALGWALFIALSIWSALQYREYRKLARWSQRPLRIPENGPDAWFGVAYAPYRMLSRQRQRTRAMGHRLRELLGLVRGIPDGVIVLNPAGDIRGMNQAAKDLLQLKESDIGLGLASVVRGPDFVAFLKADSHDESLEFISPFNAEQNFEARRFNVDDGFVVLIRDITTLNRLLTMRQNFVANVSHELRTPLTVVSGYMETIADPTQPSDLRLELIDRIPAPLKRMESLINDLLLLTQLESIPAGNDHQRFSLQRIVESSAHELLGICSNPDQIQVHCEVRGEILGIESEIRSVCVNLLENAIKYSPEGSPVCISVTEVGNNIRLAVQDKGQGIAPEHLDRLTERFYRVDLAGSRSHGGTGLGLAIVKHVLRRHRSELHIESQLGQGSLFFCDFAPAHQSVEKQNHRVRMKSNI